MAERSALGVTWCPHEVQGGEQHKGHGQEDDQGGGGGAGCLRITYCNEIMPISPRRYEETVLDCIWPPDS